MDEASIKGHGFTEPSCPLWQACPFGQSFGIAHHG